MAELEPQIPDRLRLIMPDQRGYARSYRPAGQIADIAERIMDDGSPSPTRSDASLSHSPATTGAGRSRGAAADRGDQRLSRLAIINAPHPAIFQKSLIENPEQRSAVAIHQHVPHSRLRGDT